MHEPQQQQQEQQHKHINSEQKPANCMKQKPVSMIE